MTEPAEQRRLPAAAIPLAAAVVAAVAVLFVSGTQPGLDPASLASVALLVLAVVTPLIVSDRRGVLVGLAATALAVGYGLAVGDRGGAGSLMNALVAWQPAACVTLAVLDHDRHNTVPLFGEEATPSLGPVPRRGAVRSGLIVATVLALAVTLVVRWTDSMRPGSGGADRGRLTDKVHAGRNVSKPGPYLYSDQLDTSRRFTLSNKVVLRIEAPSVDFWRGTTFDAWDGRIWTRKPGSNPHNEVDPEVDIAPHDDPLFMQTVTVIGEGSDLLFGAYRPLQFIAEPTVNNIEDDGTAHAARPMGPGSRYVVVSARPQPTEALLRSVGGVPEVVPTALRERYLQLPDVADRVVELAASVTKDEPTIYGKVRVLEAWLGSNTQYSLNIPELPGGADAVEQFLFVDRRGFCEQIASSLAVMLRSQGVPARLAVGYAGGTKRRFSNTYDVRGRDAHAWVEVWFPGQGWQAFDPTAQVPLAGESAPETRSSLTLYGAVLFGAAALVGLALWLRQRHRTRAARSWPTRILGDLERVGSRFDRPRRPDETASEYLHALSLGPLASVDLAPLAAGLVPAGFAPAEPDAATKRRAEAALQDAKRAAPPVWRRQLGLRLGKAKRVDGPPGPRILG